MEGEDTKSIANRGRAAACAKAPSPSLYGPGQRHPADRLSA